MNRGAVLVAGLAAGALVTAGVAQARTTSTSGPMGFEPIAGSAYGTAWDPTTPWLIPDGFTQTLVSGEDESTPCGLDIYPGGLDDWHDMNTVNETGRQAGRYLYRTHEVRLRSGNIPDDVYPEGGAVSVVDLETCATNVWQDPTWDALDGIRWTPWGTVLFAEETTDGRLFELVLDKNDPMNGTVYDRPAVGRLAHEGIDIGADGSVYVVDEYRGQDAGEGGGIYRFVPSRRGDLSEGDLYVLAVENDVTRGEGVGQGRWAGPIDPANARSAGTEAGGTGYQRPEDLEVIGNDLYVAITEGTRVDPSDTDSPQNYDGRVIAIDLSGVVVTDYVKPGMNAPIESGDATGFDNPDNVAEGPDGKLWIVEDNGPSDIWVAQGKGAVADGIDLFASLTDPGAEGTGIYFGKDPHTLFVNVQHSAADDGDGTWAITKD